MRQAKFCGVLAPAAKRIAAKWNSLWSLAWVLAAAVLLAGCDDRPQRTARAKGPDAKKPQVVASDAKAKRPQEGAPNSTEDINRKRPDGEQPVARRVVAAAQDKDDATRFDPHRFDGNTDIHDPSAEAGSAERPRQPGAPTDLPDPNDPAAQVPAGGPLPSQPAAAATKPAVGSDLATRFEQLAAAKAAAFVKTADKPVVKKPTKAAASDAAHEDSTADDGAENAQLNAERAKEQVFSEGLALVDDAVAADNYAIAQKTVALLDEAGPQLADQQLAAEATKSRRRVQQFEAAFKRTAAAREILSKNADDATANYTVGNYLCFLKADWDAGLPFLAKGNEAASRKAAQQDLAAPKETAERQAVADAWWAIAGRENAIAKAQVMLRARYWSSLVRPALAADAQDKLRGRMEMIDKYAVSTGVNIELGLDAALPEASGNLTLAQRGRVQKLLGDFRRAAGNSAQMESAVNKLLSIGGAAVPQLLVEVNKILQPQLKQYGEAFKQQAAAVQASRGGANMTEVERLRAQVLALKELPNLTKDMIVQQGDPAMDKLREMLVVDRAAVLEKSPRLRDDRKRLLVLGRQWERTNQALVAAMQEEAAKGNKPRKGAHKPQDDTASVSTTAPADMPAAAPAKGEMKAKDSKTASAKTAATAADKPAIQPPPTFEKYLEGEEEMAAKMVMPMDDAARAVLAENAKIIGQIDTEEGRAILACNLTRQLLGLSALKIDLKLCAAARDHSKDMATLNFFAHESPVPGKKTPWDRAKNFDTTASGENIAAGYSDGNAANQGWFHSPGHHKNMLGGHKRIGLGVHGSHYTEMFGS
jgi:uncharacterized protein YkwD